MEVKVNKDLKLGTEWKVGDRTNYNKDKAIVGGSWQSGDQLINYNQAGVPVLPDGFSLGMFGESINIGGINFPSVGAVARAYQGDSNYNILSTPQILTTDNEEAKIVVATNLAFQTTATTSSGSSNDVYNSFEYRDVGKTLTITPHISKDRMVRLKIALEVSSVKNENNNRPTTDKRTVDTTVIVKDSNTIVIGGLIDDQNDTNNSQIPCLGSVPILGWLFKNQTNSNKKTNLYVFLTPKVVKSPEEADKVYNEKRNHIQGLQEGKIKMYNQNQNSSGPVIVSDPNLDDHGAEETQNPDGQYQKKEGGYE